MPALRPILQHPQHPTSPPPPPPQSVRPRQLQHPQSVRFRPDRPRQPQHPQSVRPKPASTFKPYQLKPERGKIEPPVEVPPPSHAKQIKCMKNKLSKLNKKIRHSKRSITT